MKYVFLIYEDPADLGKVSKENGDRCFAEHMELQRSMQPGTLAATFALKGPEAALTVRSSDSHQVVLDGPFSETKELLVGLYVTECGSLEEAIEFGKRIPLLSESGTVEVRPALWSDPGIHTETTDA